MFDPTKRAWGTNEELNYLEKMPDRIPGTKDRKAFLKGYMESLRKRKKWPDMDKAVIAGKALEMRKLYG